MSTHYERIDVDHPFGGVVAVPGGTMIGEHSADGPCLVISADEVVVIQAPSREAMRAWLAKCVDSLDKLMCESLPPIVEIRARDVEVGDEIYEDQDDPDARVLTVDRIEGGDYVMFFDAEGGSDDYDGDSPVSVRKGITTVWHQKRDEKFDDAEFYEPGDVVTITGRDGYAIAVASDGKRLWIKDDAETVRTAEEFRCHFEDGKTPDDGEDGWAISNNGWFDLYDNKGEQLDDASCHSLAEALNDAIGRVRQRLGGLEEAMVVTS